MPLVVGCRWLVQRRGSQLIRFWVRAWDALCAAKPTGIVYVPALLNQLLATATSAATARETMAVNNLMVGWRTDCAEWSG
jgi:hypothetical protein